MLRVLVGCAGACLLLASEIESVASVSSSGSDSFPQLHESVLDILTEGGGLPEEFEGSDPIDEDKQIADIEPLNEVLKEGSPVDVGQPTPKLRGMRRMVIGLSLFMLAVLVHYLDSISVSYSNPNDPITLSEIGERLVLLGDELNGKIFERFDLNVDVHIWIFFTLLLLFADGAQKLAADLAKKSNIKSGTPASPVEGIFPLSVGFGGLLASQIVPALEPAQNFGIPFVLMGLALFIKSLLQRRAEYKKAAAGAAAPAAAPAAPPNPQAAAQIPEVPSVD